MQTGNPHPDPSQIPEGYRFPPIQPNQWYSVQEVALRYSCGDDYIRRTFRERKKNGYPGIKDEYKQKPGRRRWGFMRIQGAALLEWEKE